jgi:hypothetical protein
VTPAARFHDRRASFLWIAAAVWDAGAALLVWILFATDAQTVSPTADATATPSTMTRVACVPEASVPNRIQASSAAPASQPAAMIHASTPRRS